MNSISDAYDDKQKLIWLINIVTALVTIHRYEQRRVAQD